MDVRNKLCFQPSLRFVYKAIVYQRKYLKDVRSKVGYWPYRQTFYYTENANQGQTLWLL